MPNPGIQGLDIWIDFTPKNIENANLALAEFDLPELLNPDRKDEILQLIVTPNRIDFLLSVKGIAFQDAWKAESRALMARLRPIGSTSIRCSP